MITELYGIKFDKVEDLLPQEHKVFVKVGPPLFIETKILDPDHFMRFEFEIIKWVKTKPDPDDRIFHFETLEMIDNQLIYSYDKETRLIEARKTKTEKLAEKQERIDLITECQRLGIDTRGAYE